MRKKIIAILIIIFIFMPIPVTCGTAANVYCASAPDQNGNVHYYYEIEPLSIYLIEKIIHTNVKIYYSADYYMVNVKK